MQRNFQFKQYAIVYILVLIAALACVLVINKIWIKQVDAQQEHQRIIILDAGHGGEDGGAVSCTGVTESSINLQITLRLFDLLRLIGCDVTLTRSGDSALHIKGDTIAQRKSSDLQQRVSMVRRLDRGVLVSIHQNTFPDARYRGAQVFYAATDGSKELASLLQKSLVQTVNPGSRRLAQMSNGVYLLKHITCTAILVECGFLSNPREEALLRDAYYQKKLCCVIGTSISTYLDRGAVD